MLIHIAGSESGFRNDFGQYNEKTIILRRFFGVFLAKRVLDIAFLWQHQKFQVMKSYMKGCAIR